MIFDLHCDTLYELSDKLLNLDNKKLAVSLASMEKYDKIIRCFAIFTPDTLSGQKAKQHFNNLYSVFQNQLKIYGDKISQITIPQNLNKTHIGAVLTVENGNILAGEIGEIERLKKLGVKLFCLTWNGENELGFGQLKNKGLKDFGKECVSELEKNNIAVDVSHLSDKGFEDVCCVSKKPFVASHSNARKICSHKRNLEDSQILEIINRGGIIGLNFYKVFLNNDADSADKYDILRHAEHILSLGGEKALCIGTDFDGAEIIDEFNCDEKLVKIENFFCQNGFDIKTIKNILYKNAEHFFETNLKDV